MNMGKIGLRAEILFNFLFLTAVAMLLLGAIAFYVMGQSAFEGKKQAAESLIEAFGVLYANERNFSNTIPIFNDALEPGAWGVIADKKNGRMLFKASSTKDVGNVTDPLILKVMRTRMTSIELEGFNFLPISYWKGFKIASSIKKGGEFIGVILLYQPLDSLKKSIISGQRLIAISILADLVIIALYGLYILSKRVVRPVHKLIRTTENIAKGTFPEDIDLGGVKEINQLYESLRIMFKEIEQNKLKLRENIETLEETNKALLATQKELIASEKLASLGKFGAGVAHEIGNPLSAIRGYVEVLKRGYVLDEEKKVDFLSKIQNEVDRINRIIRTLLDYSRPRDYDLKKVFLNDVIRHAVEIMISQGILKRIELEMKLQEGLRPIEVDSHHLTQVIINLILNSKDAIKGDGSIIVSSYKTVDGDVELSIKDNGVGIPEEIIDKIFDPFFTTKDPGKGTGLGLSVSQRIVQLFDAVISAESKPGQGSKFRITFPTRGMNSG